MKPNEGTRSLIGYRPLAPAYSFSGLVARTPEIIDFELQTVVKARKLKVDLYVLFVIDGEKIFLSSNRWAVKKPVPGRRWVGEHLVFRMPYETLLKLVNAKEALIRMDGIDFELSEAHRSALRAFAESASTSAGDAAEGSRTQNAAVGAAWNGFLKMIPALEAHLLPPFPGLVNYIRRDPGAAR